MANVRVFTFRVFTFHLEARLKNLLLLLYAELKSVVDSNVLNRQRRSTEMKSEIDIALKLGESG